jgi:DNA segregation ATPase FtsK/SpoIIIE, S-DNA-T family
LASPSAQARNSGFSQAVARGLRESAIIALGVVALVMFVALATYSPSDRGFSSTTDSVEVHNRIGPVGAWLADIFFFLFGRPAFLFPVMLAAACWVLFRRGQTESSRMNTAVRIGGFVLVLIASCGLTTLHWVAGNMPQTAGGVVGSAIGGGLQHGLGFLGATLLMIAA